MNAEQIWNDVTAIRERNPLVHNITNYVVMNNTANALLALGASPVMAHAVDEMEEMTSLTATVSGALVINIGTLSPLWIEAMVAAMQHAANLKIPIVLDPVGAGATTYRTTTCHRLLATARPAIIRGNASEIMALQTVNIKTKGVDSACATTDAEVSAGTLARQHNSVVCASGAVDLITDGSQTLRVANGHPMMTRVTGLGCTASALAGAFAAVNPDHLAATAHAMAVMGICGEIAAKKAAGPGTLQLHFLDALYALREEDIAACLR